MIVAFTINGTSFTALNGGPQFPHTEAVSFQISCKNQEEVDYYWEKLGEGGEAKKRVCGWLDDKFGVKWQVVPEQLMEFMEVGGEKGERAYKAMLNMTKLEIEGLRKAFEGEE
jgi:predicted 3-demethylubiquinone-9 3-methyltransferase (glyoxalase superfamily)